MSEGSAKKLQVLRKVCTKIIRDSQKKSPVERKFLGRFGRNWKTPIYYSFMQFIVTFNTYSIDSWFVHMIYDLCRKHRKIVYIWLILDDFWKGYITGYSRGSAKNTQVLRKVCREKIWDSRKNSRWRAS